MNAAAIDALTVRPGDVFDFSYSAEERAKRFMPDHCFDGQLVALESGSNVVLQDSYWLYQLTTDFGDHRRFTVDEARALGTLTFKCNLSEVDIVRGEYDTIYFDPADVFDLSYQHRCHKYFAVRKGAQRSQKRMASEIATRIEREREKIKSAEWNIQHLTGQAEKVQRGELAEVYLL